jgi:hypothetical protein
LILVKVSYEYIAVAVCNRALQENDYGLHNRDVVPRVPVLLYYSRTIAGTLSYASTTGLFLWSKIYVVSISSKCAA